MPDLRHNQRFVSSFIMPILQTVLWNLKNLTNLRKSKVNSIYLRRLHNEQLIPSESTNLYQFPSASSKNFGIILHSYFKLLDKSGFVLQKAAV